MKKKLVALLLVLALAVCIFPASAFALTSDGYPNNSRRNSSGNWHIIVNSYSLYVNYGTVIRKGNTSYDQNVYAAQAALNWIDMNPRAGCGIGAQDGLFGTDTYNGVVAFQKFWNNNNAYSEGYYIDVDGIVGNCTWSCLTVHA